MIYKKYVACILLIKLVSVFLLGAGPAFAAAPTIDVWYGDTQQFGNIGNPQPYINILGTVTDPDIGDTITLSYTLNGGTPVYPPSPLGIGPNNRRLEQEGDFNIDIPVADLSTAQTNTVVITAEDDLGDQDVKTVTVQYAESNQWPFPYTIDWGTETDIQDVAQVVDGKWHLEGATVRTTIPGYDRLIAMGETDWSDYEVTVPITIHSPIDDSPGTGVLMRWQGHSDDPIAGDQPKAGYNPLGAILWYRNDNLEIWGNNDTLLGRVSKTLQTGATYIFKARVETKTGPKSIYSLKVWEQGQAEPSQWDLVREQSFDPIAGSVGLISHNRDAGFGTVTVSPIISNVEVTLGAGDTEATITWTTYENTDSWVDYGLTDSYDSSETDSALVTDHSVLLTGLTPDTQYHYQITSEDIDGNPASTGDLVFFTGDSGIASDDFSAATLDAIWTFSDGGDAAADYALVGTDTDNAWVDIAVPGGSEHWISTSGIGVPHLLQAANDTDFEVEAKFESDLGSQYQEQGILVKQDDNVYMRFEFFSDASNTNLYVSSYDAGSGTNYINKSLGTNDAVDPPLYMRVKREGDEWTVSHSFDGTNWTLETPFITALSVSGIGPYAGNESGGGSPAHTASIDYFFNTDSPIDPEDPLSHTITATAGANGTIDPSGAVGVDRGADQSFTITADPGYHVQDVLVDGVSQGAVGAYDFTNVTADHTISATFETKIYSPIPPGVIMLLLLDDN